MGEKLANEEASGTSTRVETFKVRRRDAVDRFVKSIGEEQKEQMRHEAAKSITEMKNAKRDLRRERIRQLPITIVLGSMIILFGAGIDTAASAYMLMANGNYKTATLSSFAVGVFAAVLEPPLVFLSYKIINDNYNVRNYRLQIKAAKERLRELSFEKKERED